MEIRLEPSEARVLGVLIEKALTTPDQYPLSLNALQTGCNQKSNRDPVIQMAEGEVFSSVERLRMMRLAGALHPAGSRVERFAHNARETLDVGEPELAVLAELLMRGVQTKGELRSRANRMRPIASQDDLNLILADLRGRGLVRDAAAAPGSRAGRVTELLSLRGRAPDEARKSQPAIPPRTPTAALESAPAPIPPPERAPDSGAPPTMGNGLESRVEEFEERLARLERGLAGLAESLGESLPA